MFGALTPIRRKLDVATVHIHTESSGYIPIQALAHCSGNCRSIAELDKTAIQKHPYLQSLKLAHPVTHNENFEISLLIGADHYWDIVEDHIIRGNGPTAMKSKLGYLLSGPVASTTNVENEFSLSNKHAERIVITYLPEEDHAVERFGT